MNLKDVYELLLQVEPISHWEPEKDAKELGFHYYSIQDIEKIKSNLKAAIEDDSQPLSREWLEQWDWDDFHEVPSSVRITISSISVYLRVSKETVIVANGVRLPTSPTISQFKALCQGLGVELKAKRENYEQIKE